MSTIDIDRDAAHDAAQHELNKPIYPRGSLTDQLLAWVENLFYKILAGGAKVPGGWFTITVLLVLVAVAVVVALQVARRTMRTNRGRQSALFGSQDMSSAAHRATADRFAERGQWAPAIQHRVRAVARHLEESGVLNPVPGRTATELACDTGRAMPGLDGELRDAAEIFNDVTYGKHPGTEPGYRVVADLDGRLLAHATGGTVHRRVAAPADPWAEVR